MLAVPLPPPLPPQAAPLAPRPIRPARPQRPAAPPPAPEPLPAVAVESTPADTPAQPPETQELPAPQSLAQEQELPPAQEPAAASLPVQLPDPARLSFAVTGQAKGFNYSAQAELTWQHADGRYQARQEVSLFLLGTRAQSSEGRITSQGLEPERFTDKARKTQSAQLDFGSGLAHFSDGSPDAPIAPGAQDRLSVFLQLAALLAAAPQNYAEGTELVFTTVSARRADLWTLRVRQTETLELPAGDMAALRLDKLPREGDDQRASLWLAPALQYLPVRILLQQGSGDFADLQLRDKSSP